MNLILNGKVVYAQAILESGSKFNSDINIENNNYFGMKMANIRIHTQVGENLDHAVFLIEDECYRLCFFGLHICLI
jgi:uncharacterized FlgJ-related protein